MLPEQRQLKEDNPLTIQQQLDSAFHLLSEKKALEAEKICASILQDEPQHPRALYLMGVAGCLNEKYERALDYLRQSLALDSSNIQAMYNIGAASASLKRYDDAIAAYCAVLNKDPNHVFSLNNLGTVLVDTGKPQEAASYFKRALELNNQHAFAPVNLVRAETATLPMPTWPAHCNSMLLSSIPLSKENRYLLLIQRAMAEWATGDTHALGLSLWAARNVQPPSTLRTKNSLTYEEFLSVLLSYRTANPNLYAQKAEKVHMVGDSHCLSYANTSLSLNAKDYTIETHLIIGAKAWHIAADKPNQYQAAFDAYVQRLPEGSSLICSFGEIDCRIDTGILPHIKKTRKPLNKTVTEQVARYVAAMRARTSSKRLQLAFLSVPPPHPNSGDRREVVRLFNAALEKEVRKSGYDYIDVYRTTVGKAGYVASPHYIDEFHLKPEILQLAVGGAAQNKLDIAFRLLGEKKIFEAERLCLEVLKQAPTHAHAVYLLGTVYCFSGQYERALDSLRQAIALNPRNILAHYNIGVACNGLKRNDEAVVAYQAALAIDPNHAHVLNNLGTTLVNTGRIEEALPHLRLLLQKHPDHPMAAYHLLKAATQMLPMAEWPTSCNELLKMQLMDENRFMILIHRATAEWMNNNLDALKTTLAEAATVRPTQTLRAENSLKYEIFLNKLAVYNSSNEGAPLFLIGDSHVLSYANSFLNWNDTNYKISAQLIIGAKAWHVTSSQPNQYTAALGAYIDRLPQGATLLLSFGEIDCRINEGILPHCKKTGRDLEKTVVEQVARYVAAMSERAQSKALKLAFLSVPRPHLASGDRGEVIRLFNTALEKETQQAGHTYINLHDLEMFIDEYHLEPAALQCALGKQVNSAENSRQ